MYKPTDKNADVQGTTKFTGKVWDKQVAQADADLRVMQANKGTREILDVVESASGPSATEVRGGGASAKLPKKGA